MGDFINQQNTGPTLAPTPSPAPAPAPTPALALPASAVPAHASAPASASAAASKPAANAQARSLAPPSAKYNSPSTPPASAPARVTFKLAWLDRDGTWHNEDVSITQKAKLSDLKAFCYEKCGIPIEKQLVALEHPLTERELGRPLSDLSLTLVEMGLVNRSCVYVEPQLDGDVRPLCLNLMQRNRNNQRASHHAK